MTDAFNWGDRSAIEELARKLEEDMQKVTHHHERVQSLVKGTTPVLGVDPGANVQFASGKDSVDIDIQADGTNTVVVIRDEQGGVIGEGWARRRKGDTRDQAVGITLATARAFQDAAEYFAGQAQELLH